MRKPFQGVTNIIRFNWHYYVISLIIISSVLLLYNSFLPPFQYLTRLFIIIAIVATIVSLLVSTYIYDLSGFYSLNWLNKTISDPVKFVVNINAGFDETSLLLNSKFPDQLLTVFDFYDRKRHTEVSIARARKVYPPFPGTMQISTTSIPLSNNSTDRVFAILAAHEIRDEEERGLFFKEINRILNENGRVIVTEHIRDLSNLIAYNIGAFHFLPRSAWKKSFEIGGFSISEEVKITPFITTFILKKNGNSS